jgi:3-oxoacyl-[acyl-carrier protein] reductase
MKSIFITGVSKGIGRAIALDFGKSGCHHFYISHKDYDNMERFQSIKTILEQNCNIVTGMYLDVTNRIWLNKLVKNLNIDNNAGIIQDHTLKNMNEDEWDNVINVNLTGMFNVTKAFLPFIQRGGCIINITSIKGIIGGFGQCNYAASKAGMIGFTKSLAKEVAKNDIRVNAIACGYIDTDITKTIPKEYMDKILESIPMKRMGTPEEIAKTVRFICENGTYCTGQTYIIDGGLT